MPRIKVTALSRGLIQRQATIIRELSERQIEAIARETELVIKRNISERIKRSGSTGNLANSFTTVKISNGWGVGDISYLNSNAPYWYWQNFGVAQSGRRIPPASKGQFDSGNPAPSSSGGNSRWSQSSSGNYFIRPKKAIQAKNYIQATVNEINQIVSSVVSRIKL